MSGIFARQYGRTVAPFRNSACQCKKLGRKYVTDKWGLPQKTFNDAIFNSSQTQEVHNNEEECTYFRKTDGKVHRKLWQSNMLLFVSTSVETCAVSMALSCFTFLHSKVFFNNSADPPPLSTGGGFCPLAGYSASSQRRGRAWGGIMYRRKETRTSFIQIALVLLYVCEWKGKHSLESVQRLVQGQARVLGQLLIAQRTIEFFWNDH